MIEPKYVYLHQILTDTLEKLRNDAEDARAWDGAARALASVQLFPEDAELKAAVEANNLHALRQIVAEWASGERTLTQQDRGVLKRALKAFRKRLKLARLDAESTVGGGPMSAGRVSSIVGVRPPDQYPQAVWDELVRQRRLTEGRHGLYELPSE